MGEGIIDAEARLHVARLAVNLIREITRVYFNSERFGASADELMLCLAIFIGQVEGRPMNTSKLAEYAGVPRPSTIRKLASLQRRGLVIQAGGAYLLPEELLNSSEAIRAARKIRREVIRVAIKVSRMDSVAVASAVPP